MVWLTNRRHSASHLLKLHLLILVLILSLCFNLVIANNFQKSLDKTMIDYFLFDQYHVHARYSVPFKRLSAPPSLRPTLDAYTQVQALELAHTDGSKSVGTIPPTSRSPINRIHFYSVIHPNSQVGININRKNNEMASLLWSHESPIDGGEEQTRLVHVERFKSNPKVKWYMDPLEHIIKQHPFKR